MADAGAIAAERAGTAVEWRVEPGLLDYRAALAAMEARAAAIRAGDAAELVWLVEHPPLYTAGTSAQPCDLLNPAGLPAYRTGRGGQWTYHGPGQRTAYVLLDLARPHGTVPARDVRRFVQGLEAWLIASARPARRRGRDARGTDRNLGRRAGRGEQDRRDRRARDALGELARGRAQRRAEPRALRWHRALRHPRARSDEPRSTRPPGSDGRGGRSLASRLERGVRGRVGAAAGRLTGDLLACLAAALIGMAP